MVKRKHKKKFYEYDYDLNQFKLSKETKEAMEFIQSIGISIPDFLNKGLQWLYQHFIITSVDGEIDQDLLQSKLNAYKEDIENNNMVI